MIQYLYVQNLSDNVGIALVPSNSPFLFDMASLPEAIENFEAPESSADASTLDPSGIEVEIPDLPETEATPLPGASDSNN